MVLSCRAVLGVGPEVSLSESITHAVLLMKHAWYEK
jgi:hypothetical protein